MLYALCPMPYALYLVPYASGFSRLKMIQKIPKGQHFEPSFNSINVETEKKISKICKEPPKQESPREAIDHANKGPLYGQCIPVKILSQKL